MIPLFTTNQSTTDIRRRRDMWQFVAKFSAKCVHNPIDYVHIVSIISYLYALIKRADVVWLVGCSSSIQSTHSGRFFREISYARVDYFWHNIVYLRLLFPRLLTHFLYRFIHTFLSSLPA